uniref:Uncharacterized protein n=1 Tax=Megaselia scalaris TaxID=36166 RepID=T1GWK8_MEGSC
FCVLSDGTRSGTCTHITKCSGGHFGPNDPLSYTKCSTGFLMICCPLGFDKTLTSTEAPTTTKASTTTFEESSIHFKTGTLTISAQKQFGANDGAPLSAAEFLKATFFFLNKTFHLLLWKIYMMKRSQKMYVPQKRL